MTGVQARCHAGEMLVAGAMERKEGGKAGRIPLGSLSRTSTRTLGRFVATGAADGLARPQASFECALAALFNQVLQLCERVTLVKLGHVALDETWIKTNASKRKVMSCEPMAKRGEESEAEFAA